MTEEIVPILRVQNARRAASWYARLGFKIDGEHQFGPGMPVYMFISRGAVHLHLSEHQGDARPDTLVYFYVDNIEPIAAEFGMVIEEQPWAREVCLTDPDGNRFRIGQRKA